MLDRDGEVRESAVALDFPEAGLGFDAAMLRVTEKWQNALSNEFGRALSEIRMGVSRRDALRSIVTRTDVPDVASADPAAYRDR